MGKTEEEEGKGNGKDRERTKWDKSRYKWVHKHLKKKSQKIIFTMEVIKLKVCHQFYCA